MHLRWTATLPPSEVPAKWHAPQGAPTTVGFDAEETTAVSKLPSDMAAVLRESTDDLTARVNLPSAGAAGPGSASTDDEATIVNPAAAEDESTIVNPATIADPTVVGRPPTAPRPSSAGLPPASTDERPVARPPAVAARESATHELTLMDVSRRRLVVIGSGVAAGLLAIAIVVGVVARARRPSSDRPGATAAGPTAAVAPPTVNSAPPSPASNPTPSPAADDPMPPAPPAAAPAETPPVAGAAPAVERRRSRGREPPRGAGPSQAPVVAQGGAKSVSQGGPCRITVGTYPWSDLWLDGADTGQQTPVVDLPVACGIHRLEFKRRDLKIDQIETVTVTEAREFKRQYELQGSGVDD